MFLKQIIKLAVAASLALTVATSYSMKKFFVKNFNLKQQSPLKQLTSYIRNFNPQTIVTESPYGTLEPIVERIKLTPVPTKKITKRRTIVVPTPEGGLDLYPAKKTVYYDLPKKNPQKRSKLTELDQKENAYFKKILEELKHNHGKKPTLTERYAGVPKAQEKFELLFKKVCKKPLSLATVQDLKRMQTALEKNENLKKCNEAYIEELKKTEYRTNFYECIKGNKNACKKSTEAAKNAGKKLYWANFPIEKIVKTSMTAGHPKNFKNTEEDL